MPWLGGKPSGAPAGVPGMGGAPVPGMGRGLPVPGMGGQVPGVTPPFMQQPAPEPRVEYEYAYAVREGGGEPQARAIARTPVLLTIIVLAALALLFAFMGGKGWNDRVELNVSIRDAMIVQYEIQKAVKVFEDLDTVINSALLKANKHEYDQNHIDFLANRVRGIPLKPELFAERNYKQFGHLTVLRLTDYYIKWSMLYQMTAIHRQKTHLDEGSLTAASAQFQKLIAASFGVVFKRDETQGNKLVANVILLGPSEEKKGKTTYVVQAAAGKTGRSRTLYNPPEEGDNGEFAKSPDDFVIEVSPESKAGLLEGASLSQFDAYTGRLRDIQNQMKLIRDIQTPLMNKLGELASQDPAWLAPPNPESAFEAYVVQEKKGEAEAGAATPKGE